MPALNQRRYRIVYITLLLTGSFGFCSSLLSTSLSTSCEKNGTVGCSWHDLSPTTFSARVTLARDWDFFFPQTFLLYFTLHVVYSDMGGNFEIFVFFFHQAGATGYKEYIS